MGFHYSFNRRSSRSNVTLHARGDKQDSGELWNASLLALPLGTSGIPLLEKSQGTPILMTYAFSP